MPSTVRPLLAGRICFGAGGCLPIRHGVGGFVTNASSSAHKDGDTPGRAARLPCTNLGIIPRSGNGRHSSTLTHSAMTALGGDDVATPRRHRKIYRKDLNGPPHDDSLKRDYTSRRLRTLRNVRTSVQLCVLLVDVRAREHVCSTRHSHFPLLENHSFQNFTIYFVRQPYCADVYHPGPGQHHHACGSAASDADREPPRPCA